jgi:NAD(P)-dependent dehydrogenase (short-subunit alcohol dehydrogenase family)
MMDLAGRTWLVLGASSSVARAFGRLVAARGAAVLLAGRDSDDLNRSAADLTARYGAPAHVLAFDARDRASIASVIEQCGAHVPAGALDVFLAFGSMPEQAEMEADPALAVATIEANYTGAVALLLGLAPLLEAGRRGHVIVLGSVAGDRGRLKNYIYGSAKAGLATFTAGLRNRLFRAGVLVTTVKPGFMDTAMTWGLPGMFLVAQPDDAARACLEAALKGREIVYYPRFWALIMLIIRLIPERIFKKLSI